MANSIDKAKRILDASTLWPVPYKLDKHSAQLDEEAWQNLKAKHNAYWRNRFGLDDAKPFKMLPGALHCKAILQNNEIKLNLPQPIVVKSPMPSNWLKQYANKHQLVLSLAKADSEYTSYLLCYSPLPEHDWHQWIDAQLFKGELQNAPLNKNKILGLMQKYKAGLINCSLSMLEAYIHADTRFRK